MLDLVDGLVRGGFRLEIGARFGVADGATRRHQPVDELGATYLMRWPVLRLSWLKEIFSDSEVAGYSATGQVTSERRKKPFQFARGAMDA
jgi:hypothetical protein